MAKFIKRQDLAIISAAVLWGCISLFTRPMQENGFSSPMIVAVRAVTTTVVMFFVILIKDRSLLKIRLKDLWMFLGTGIASFLFFNVCYMSSIGENSVSVACMLMYTSPIWVTLFSELLFKEKLTVGKLLALLICIISCAVLCLSSSLRLSSIGLVYGLLSGLGYGLYSIFSIYALKKYSFWTATFYAFCFSALSLIPFCDWGTVVSATVTNGSTALLFLGLSFIITVLPYIIYTCGLKKVPPSEASVIACVEPVVATLVGVLIYGQTLGILGALGMTLVLVAVMILSYKK